MLRRRFGAIGGAELLENPLHMVLYRKRADAKNFGDLVVGSAVGDPIHDLLLTRAQVTGSRCGIFSCGDRDRLHRGH